MKYEIDMRLLIVPFFKKKIKISTPMIDPIDHRLKLKLPFLHQCDF